MYIGSQGSMGINQVIEYMIYIGTDWEVESDIYLLGYIE
ncbi:hypothetical protein ES703_91721 [subsurface metagenome]